MALIDVAWLERALTRNPAPVVLDVRWSLGGGADRTAYETAHIPTARFLDLDARLCGPAGPGGRHPLPDPDTLQTHLRAVGIDDDSRVVVYDGGDMLAASRTWWTLRWAGLASVDVLDGGWSAWTRGGGKTVTALPVTPREGTITVRPGGMPSLTAGQAAALAAEHRLVDVRAAARYRGETEPIDPVAGHIPGAVNLPGERVMAADGGFVSEEVRANLFAGHAAGAGVYCGSGVTAARTALAMEATPGVETPAVYIGSWSEWITDPDRPVAVGDE